MTRPRAADDFTTIRARMEELRRERALATKKEGRDPDDTGSGGRNLLKPGESRQRLESRQRPEHQDWPTGASSRRYGSTR